MTERSASHAQWTGIDDTDDPSFFIRFLDASRAGVVAAAREDPGGYFAHLDVRPGQQILDAACGVGDLTCVLATLVAPGGQVVGLDFSRTMVEEASRRAASEDVPVRFEQGDIMSLPFSDNSFDRARAEQVLQHIPHPQRAVAELARVTGPGGIIAVHEPDWDTLIVDADDLASSRAFTVYNSQVSVPQGAIGRQLPALFRDAGLVDVAVTPSVVMPPYQAVREFLESTAHAAVQDGQVAAVAADSWLRDLAERAERGRFFAAFSYFRVTGRVPQ